MSAVGVVATADIPEGSVIARLPRSALLTSLTGRVRGGALEGDRVFQQQMRRRPNSWVPLLLALLAEKEMKV